MRPTAPDPYSEQGAAGAEQALVVGLVFGTIYAVTKQLWMLMIAHAMFDLTAVAIIYCGWERALAEFFFKVSP
jgi:hypothetical protein